MENKETEVKKPSILVETENNHKENKRCFLFSDRICDERCKAYSEKSETCIILIRLRRITESLEEIEGKLS